MSGAALPPDDLTTLLGRMDDDPAVRDQVFAAVYRQLRDLAAAVLHPHREQTLQPTDLLHAAYVRLVADRRPYATRKHFFCVAAQAMKQALVDHVRRRDAEKRGGDLGRADASALEQVARSFEEKGLLLLDLDAALTRLGAVDPEAERMAVLVLFGGFSRTEAAELLGLSGRSGDRVWAFARARLERALSGWGPDPSDRPVPAEHVA